MFEVSELMGSIIMVLTPDKNQHGDDQPLLIYVEFPEKFFENAFKHYHNTSHKHSIQAPKISYWKINRTLTMIQFLQMFNGGSLSRKSMDD